MPHLEDWQIACSQTDTVWGLVAKFSKENFQKIYEIKNRDFGKPLILFINSLDKIQELVKWNPLAQELAHKHFPGPLTIILDKSDNCPDWLNPNTNSIGFRMPKSPSINKLFKDTEGILLSTSANISNEATVSSYEEALQFKDSVDFILKPKANEKLSQEASTIVKIENNEIKILREGSLSLESLTKMTA